MINTILNYIKKRSDPEGVRKQLKYIRYIALLHLIFNINKQSLEVQASVITPEPFEQTIWVITDIHHLSPTLFDQGSKFEEMQASAAGLDLRYGFERLQALIQQIEIEKPDVLLIAGDLTLNGEYQSMKELAEAFHKIERMGTQVFVVPGNHDISNPWASSFIEANTIRVDQTLPSDFQILFEDFGFKDALSRDSASLSYVAELSQTWQLLMLDSNVYSQTAGLYAPKSHGQLTKKTLNWLEKELEVHQSTDKQTLVVVHHNSLVHFPSLNQGYTLDNAKDLQILLKRFQLPITLSGHIHAQHIAQEYLSDDFMLTDIATGAFGVYPNRIGVITLSESSFHYHTSQLDMTYWLNTQIIDNPNLLAYDSYLQNLLAESSRLIAEREIIAHHAYSSNDAEEVIELFTQLNQATFSGNLKSQWPTLMETYSVLLENLISYGNDFFNAYLLDIINLQDEEHQQIEITW